MAIVMVELDYDPERKLALLTVPFEFSEDALPRGKTVETVGSEGDSVGQGKVVAVKSNPAKNKCRRVLLEVPYEEALSVAGIRIQSEQSTAKPRAASAEEDFIICRCERVSKKEIIEQIRAGARDMNQLKAVLRTGLGACGGKTCRELILGIFKEEGIPLREITPFTLRPFEAEIPLGAVSGCGVASGAREKREG